MALIYPKQLRVSGSDLQAGIPTAGVYTDSALNPTMSIADALNAVATISGSGTDGLWTGSFDNGHIERISNVSVVGDISGSKDLRIASSDARLLDYSTGHLLQVGPGESIGRIMVEGSSWAQLLLIDSGAPAGAKVIDLITNDGITSFQTHDDGGDTDRTYIIAISHSTGDVGIGTSSPAVTGLHVWSNISASNLYWGGTDLTSFSSSVATQIQNFETGSGQWTLNNDGTISRNSDVKISGSLYLSGSDNRLYGTSSQAVSASSALWAITASYAENAGGSAGLWTGSFSDGHIERVSDVQITGSLYQLGNSASFQDYVEVNGFMHVNGGTW